MIFLTPKVGRLLHHEVVVDSFDLAFDHRSVEVAIAKAAHDVLEHIVNDCAVVTGEMHHGLKFSKVSINVVITTPDEFSKAQRESWGSGWKEGSAPCDHAEATARAEKAEAELKLAVKIIRDWQKSHPKTFICGTSKFLEKHGGAP